MQIQVPVKNDEGAVEFTATMNDKEIQAVLQFGLNIALSMGIMSQLLSPDSLEAAGSDELQ